METTSPPEDLSISLKGRYDFVVTEELLQIMDSQKRVDVTWKFDDKNSKQSNRNHQLQGDFVKMLCRRLQTSVGPLLSVTQKQSSVVRGYAHSFMLTPASMDASGMIGHLFILKNKTIREVLLKLTTHRKYWVMCLLMVNKKLPYSVRQNQFFGAQSKESLSFRSSWEQILTFLLFQFQ